jgi:tRNA-dihydrouridine synthase
VKAKEFLDQSGVDALMIGRGSIGRPWIFKEIRHYLQTGEMLPMPKVSDVVENVKEQLKQSVMWKDEPRRAILEMRRHFVKYFPNLKDFRELRVRLLQTEDFDQVNDILDEIAQKYAGERVDYSNVGLK